MQLALIYLPCLFTLAETVLEEWPLERRSYEESPAQAAADIPISDYRKRASSEALFTRERRVRLCGKKIIEQLLLICDSCILPAGSEIVKRSDQNSVRQATRRLMKRELSIATKCCVDGCSLSELEQLCCKSG
ncbi:unnamed protein product [Cylicocyclus nassatus]|uniref:Insulin-like domain-containing protein n=1 Tax=Cylicocyclus nassatus TaxID=53992 RepID=A0AA36H9G8_CYLNA|nr:unnamed protein product [Cylicocyclus nassatus]